MDVLRGVACLLLGYVSFAAVLALERLLRMEDDPDPTPAVIGSEISAGTPDPLEPNPVLAVRGLTFMAWEFANATPGSCLTCLISAIVLGACAAGTYALDAWVGLFCFWVALVSIVPIGMAYTYLLWRRAESKG